jgi:hypothetical protein
MGPWAIRYTVNISNFYPMPLLTSTHPKSILYFPYWSTGPELFMTISLLEELDFLKVTFWQKSYSKWQISRALTTPESCSAQWQTGFTHFSAICLVNLQQHLHGDVPAHHVKCLPTENISILLWLVRDNLGLRTLGIYSMIYE